MAVLTALGTITLETRLGLERAARLASEFLLASQDRDGAWRDFQLTPGRAESWTTAYVGSSLLAAKELWRDPRVDEPLNRAARFLCAARQPGGWSYNQRCGPDADTIAQVILFLQRLGKPVAMKDYAALAKFQTQDGLFATYKSCGGRKGWESGHAEVTAVAMQAIGKAIDSSHSILRRAESSLRSYLKGAHAAESYWWTSKDYLPRELLMLARSYPRAPNLFTLLCHSRRGEGAFDRALALEVSALTDGNPEEQEAALAELIKLQSSDGSWPVEPILRIPDPRALGFDDPLFNQSLVAADDRRTFTAATVLRAFAALCHNFSEIPHNACQTLHRRTCFREIPVLAG